MNTLTSLLRVIQNSIKVHGDAPLTTAYLEKLLLIAKNEEEREQKQVSNFKERLDAEFHNFKG